MRSVRHPDAARLLRLLKDRRLLLGMSQEMVAGQLGTTRQVISDIECGRKSVQLGALLRYAEALDLRMWFEMRGE